MTPVTERRTVLVTGGAKGIGSAIVEKFAREGYNVGFTYLTSKAQADETVERCRPHGLVFSVKADLNKPADTRRAFRSMIKRFGRVDVVVNNASIISRPNTTIENVTGDEWDAMMRTNVKGPMLLSKLAFEHMTKQGGGHLVNIASVAALGARPTVIDYAASKAAILSLTRSLALHGAPKGIIVNAVAPGPVQGTDMLKNVAKDLLDKASKDTPVGSFAHPESIADAVFFLGHSTNTHIVGQTLTVDGGRQLAV